MSIGTYPYDPFSLLSAVVSPPSSEASPHRPGLDGASREGAPGEPRGATASHGAGLLALLLGRR